MKIPNDGTSHDIIFLNLQFKNFLPQITQISTDLPDGSQVEFVAQTSLTVGRFSRRAV